MQTPRSTPGDSAARFRLPTGLILVGLLVSSLGLVLGGEFREISGQRVMVATPSDAGEWGGTWYYVSRREKMALWLRGEPAKPEVRIRYISLASGESFKTDWTANGEYIHRGSSGTFGLEITEADADLIRGKWSWTLSAPHRERRETADIEMYRSGDGRQFVMIFDNLVREVHDTREYAIPVPQAWTFRKASSGIALWEEMPF